MLWDSLGNLILIGVAALSVVFFASKVWSGISGNNKDEKYVLEKLSKLFGTLTASRVAADLIGFDISNDDAITLANPSELTRVPNVAGSIRLGPFSAAGTVYSGSAGVYIGGLERETYIFIPWEQVGTAQRAGNQRLKLLVEEIMEVDIPWSDNMSLRGWNEYSAWHRLTVAFNGARAYPAHVDSEESKGQIYYDDVQFAGQFELTGNLLKFYFDESCGSVIEIPVDGIKQTTRVAEQDQPIVSFEFCAPNGAKHSAMARVPKQLYLELGCLH